MGVKSFAARLLAKRVNRQTLKWSASPNETQQRVFLSLLDRGKDTVYGEDHDFAAINNYDDFKEAVPVSDYEQLRPYISQIQDGEENVLWPGRPLYFAKTSGT